MKEKNHQIYPLENLVKLYDVLINGLAFCQILGYFPREFSYQSILCEAESNNQLSLNFVDFVLLKNKNIIDNNKKGEFFDPEANFKTQNHNLNKKSFCKNGVFFLAFLILRIGVGYQIIEEHNEIFSNIVDDEKTFNNEIDLLLRKIQMIYLKHEEGKNKLLTKLINNLRDMMNFNDEERPDFLELFRKNIDLEDVEKVKAHIFVSEGMKLPLFERNEDPVKKNLNVKKGNNLSTNGRFELNSIDQMVKVIGSGGIQMKQTFSDEM